MTKELINTEKRKKEIEAIQKEREKFGLPVATVPEPIHNTPEGKRLKAAIEYLIADLQSFLREGVKFPIGFKLELLSCKKEQTK